MYRTNPYWHRARLLILLYCVVTMVKTVPRDVVLALMPHPVLTKFSGEPRSTSCFVSNACGLDPDDADTVVHLIPFAAWGLMKPIFPYP